MLKKLNKYRFKDIVTKTLITIRRNLLLTQIEFNIYCTCLETIKYHYAQDSGHIRPF